MAINRKGLRKITVDGQEYFWRFVVDGAVIFQEDPFGKIALDFRHIPMIEDMGDQDRKGTRNSFESKSVTPKHISKAIEFAKGVSWTAGNIELTFRDGEIVFKENTTIKYDIPTALERLGFHSARDPRIHDPRWENGILSSLRPYRGIELVEENYHDIVRCMQTLIEIFQQETINRELVNDMAGIITFGRAWGCHPDGMLKSNNLITEKDAARLEEMINDISYVWTMILDGIDEPEFEYYFDRNSSR